MSYSPRSIWVFGGLTAAMLTLLTVSVAVGGLGRADQVASVIGVLVGVAGVGVSVFGSARRPTETVDRRHDLRRVAIAGTGAGVLYLFAVTRHGRVVRRSYRAGTGTWSDPLDAEFPGGRPVDVAAVAVQHDRIECYVADCDGRLWSAAVGEDQQLIWNRLDPSQHSKPVVAIDAMSGWPGHRELYAVFQDGALQHRWKWDGQPWEVWHSADLDRCRDIALSVPAKNQMECFALNRDGGVHHRWYLDEKWSEWHAMDSPRERYGGAALSAVNGSDRHQEVFLVGTAGELAHRWHWQGEEWAQWYLMENPDELVDVATSATGVDHMECVAVSASGRLWQRSYNPVDRWSMWRRIN